MNATLAALYKDRRQFPPARTYLYSAYKLANYSMGSNHPIIAEYSTQLGHIYKALFQVCWGTPREALWAVHL